jgi:5-methylcytosine-specific restriction endonuclease McrA
MIRKHSKNVLPKLKERADRALQDYFRRHKTKCEMCGGRYEVAHHFIHKKLSNYLRYDENNLIFVCQSCHSKFHSFPEPTYPIRVQQMRGQEWLNYIESHRHLEKKFTRSELEEIIKKYGV